MMRGGGNHEVAAMLHTARNQRVMDAAAQLTFLPSLYSVWDPGLSVDITVTQGLLFLVNPLWKHPQKYREVGFLKAILNQSN